MITSILNNNRGTAIASAGVFFFYALTFAIPSGYSYGSALLLLTSLAWMASRPTIALSNEDKTIALLLLAVFVVSLVAFVFHRNSPKTLDQTSRCLLLIPVLFFMLKVPPRLAAVWAGLFVGAVSAAAVALWQYHILGLHRPDGFMTSAIPFGGISLAAGILCLAGIIWARTQVRHTRLWQAALAIGFLAGLYTSFVSGSRGGWLAIPIVFTIFCCALLKKDNIKQALIASLLVLAALAIAISSLQSQISARYENAISEIDQYVQQDDASTSVGMRLEAWRVAAISIAERPLLGWSHKEYDERLHELAAEKKSSASITSLSNTHNNYIEAWLHQGIFGLLALLALYIVPFIFFCRRLRSQSASIQALAIAGTSLLASFFVFGLTQVILGRNNGIIFFTVTLIILWACMRNEENKLPHSVGHV